MLSSEPSSLQTSELRASRPIIAVTNSTPESEPTLSMPLNGSTVPQLKTGTVVESSEPEHATIIDSTPLLAGGRFSRDGRNSSGPDTRTASPSPLRLPMPAISPGQLAFSALQYLPVPTLVLNSLKTVVLANEALGRMLGLVQDNVTEIEASTTLERLRGQTLSQVGIDMLQDGHPVWVTWEVFLDALVDEMGVRAHGGESHSTPEQGGEATPTADKVSSPIPNSKPNNQTVQDAVIDVVISRTSVTRSTAHDVRTKGKSPPGQQVFAKMIISIWEIEDRQTYFSLTFTNSESSSSSLVTTKKSIARSSILEAAERKTISTPSVAHSNPPSLASSRNSSSPSFYSPSAVTMSSSPFPPMGPPSVATQSATPSILQKMIRLKDALLDKTQVPILAMWKDGSVTFPNKAARRYFRKDINLDASVSGTDVLDNWVLWDEHFTERLDPSQYPITTLLETQAPCGPTRIGLYDENNEKVVFEVTGEVIRDENTGEFLAGVVSGRDCTSVTKEITEIKESNEERFRIICDTMPQLVWTTSPDGHPEFFNSRWYTYTGLTDEQCMGEGWMLPFHPDDLQASVPLWEKSVATGEPFVTEWRCRSKEGKWRWFLARASAMRNKETGKIEKWFGTCTDAHEGIQSKMDAERTRKQLLSVISHSRVTIFTADMKRRVTMLEGALIWDNDNQNYKNSEWFIGENVYTVFNRLTEQLAEGEKPDFLQPIEAVLNGQSADGVGVDEHPFNNRWYRTRFLPMYCKDPHKGKPTTETVIEGVIGVIMDVTELRDQKIETKETLKEKRKAVANEAAAKEATRLKSQFLANMSHEIRTPITGVLGMAELLASMELDEEQRDYVENIHSSATSLLTVINDILDFSKVESGRLDIEEVQFSLSVIVNEVVRMLQFAVKGKNLDFQSDIGGDIREDMVVIGDPGRVRQIITNLLTNSIKFTNQGYVRFSVSKEKETADSIEIKFVVEDTGIGIQEDVRKKLFQPFSQGDASTARRFGGTGLGLTISKNLVDLMHGRITLDSRVGSGTTVTFWITFSKPQGRGTSELAQAGAIPDRLQSELSLSCNSSEHENLTSASEGIVRRPSLRTAPITGQEISRAERGKLHVLVVEDNPVNQKIATKTINKLGFKVTAAWNGREALDYLLAVSKGLKPKPDMILMDVQMPVIDGYKCTHLLRHHLPYKHLVQDVPIVAMTASAIQGDREKCKKAGMDDYLAKPVTMSILEKMLTRWCLNKRKPRPSPAPSASDCSELNETCENADIPHVGLEDNDSEPFVPDSSNNSPITPRPLTISGGHQHEQSPFDSPIAADFGPTARRQEGENEWSSHLQETKLMGAAGGPSSLRSNSFQERPAGEALTEENVNKLKIENQQQRR
ncbi:unnamed protein product [Clonostachys rosea]|uniref:histidine kinase n=1 Tax=Bionectria ochroleuca TaxID=29856 RepID=A0ABY6UX60_BIOOC|nr:unnamed protein product [Clonostachys rosea]